MLSRLGFARAGRVVCLGPPLNGSQVAVAFGRWPGAPRMLGKSIAGLLASGGFGRWEGEARVGVIAGSWPLGLGRLVKRLPGVNDGVVTVDETRLPGLADHIVVDTCHIGLLFSKATAEQTLCFLEQGTFCHERLATAAVR
jgi:hypothetical protein